MLLRMLSPKPGLNTRLESESFTAKTRRAQRKNKIKNFSLFVMGNLKVTEMNNG
jgi:hypothetical protein